MEKSNCTPSRCGKRGRCFASGQMPKGCGYHGDDQPRKMQICKELREPGFPALSLRRPTGRLKARAAGPGSPHQTNLSAVTVRSEPRRDAVST